MKRFFSLLIGISTCFYSNANTYTVVNNNNTGVGSLRQAILDANTNGGADLIDFNIPGAAPHTIICTSDLPNITDNNTVINGNSQPANGFTGLSPKIILQGTGSSGEGLYIQSHSCSIYGLYIHLFNYGIRISNTGDSIKIGSATNGEGNVISGNNSHGIFGETSAFYFVIKGNFIGVDTLGVSDEGNGGYGLFIGNQTSTSSFKDSKNEIGGVLDSERNIISGNDGGGVNFGSYNIRSKVINNYIGTDVSGTIAIANTGHGVRFGNFSGSISNLGRIEISNNVIANNTGDGILFGTNASYSIFTNNYIGVNAAGNVAMSNGGYGMYFGNFTPSSSIGGSCKFDSNVIANCGNTAIYFNSYAFRCSFRYNMIGVDASGSIAMGNTGDGIRFSTMTSSSSTGASDTLEFNVISNNTSIAINFSGNHSMHTFITENKIGVDSSGTIAMGNGGHGIYYGGNFTSSSAIGTNSNITNNIISNNGASGIYYDHAQYTSQQKIKGNYIGVDITGTNAMGNSDYGIFIGGTTYSSSSSVNRNAQIGGGTDEGNIISANGLDGIRFETSGTPTAGLSVIEGNIIGTDINETIDLGNGGYGIYMPSVKEIGNTLSCNTIAYNTNEGIGIDIATSINNAITGNSIFCNAQSSSAKGIDLNGLANNNLSAPVITAVVGNVVTGTGSAGSIQIFMSNSSLCGGSQAQHYVGEKMQSGAWSYDLSLDGSTTISNLSGNITAITYNNTDGASEISNVVAAAAYNSADIPTNCSSPPVLVSVKWLSFSVIYNTIDNVVDLKWKTTDEINNKGFEIQKSTDGKNFNQIGWTNPKSDNKYLFIDNEIQKNVIYYRLKQVNYNGTHSYSKIEKVDVKSQQLFNVYPNPFSDEIIIDSKNKSSLVVNVYDALGRQIYYHQYNNTSNIKIETKDYENGVYYIQVKSNNTIKTFKTIKIN